jgi:hypothetical protein
MISSIAIMPTYQTTQHYKPEDHSMNVSSCSYECYCFYSIPFLHPHTHLLVSMISRTLIPDEDFIFKWTKPLLQIKFQNVAV